MKSKDCFRRSIALMLTLCMTGLLSINALAETRTKITSVRLKVSSSIEAGSDYGDVEVVADSPNFTVGEVEILNDIDDEWEIGSRPRVRVWLYAEDNYYFHSSSSNLFKFTGDDADYSSAHTEDSGTVMVLTFKLDKVEGDLAVDEVEWEEGRAVGYWTDNDGADYYQVRLYRNDSSVTSAITVHDTMYDFSQHISRTGDYNFRVRAVVGSSSKGEWIDSDYLYVDQELLSRITQSGSIYSDGTWQRNDIGWWYRYHNGGWPANTWKYINNYWYFFNADGYMRTGWILWNNIWYYCDTTSGAMYANTRTPDGYTVGPNGEWLGY